MPAQRPPLTPRGLAVILLCLAVLSGLTYYRLSRPQVSGTSELAVYTGETMGTTYTVKLVLNPEPDLANDTGLWITSHIASTLERVNGLMSTYRPDSELSRLNQSRNLEPFTVSEETLEVIAAAREVSEVTDGAFDITVGPLVNAWGFGPEVHVTGPSDEEIAALLETIGYRNLEIDRDASTVQKKIPGLYCDLSAIAKGYAVDKIAEAFEAQGIPCFVEVGGEIRASGPDEAGAPRWTAGIEQPLPDRRTVHRTVPLHEMAMATSGDYRNYYEQDGVRISHEIDPRTGRPIAHALASVSVLHPSCMVADAYATAFMVLGPDEGYALAERLDMAVLFLVHTRGAAFEERITPAFAAYLEKHHAPEPAKGYN